jgi:hypothetical protein
MLFHVLVRVRPPDRPGIFTSVCWIYVLPVARLIGLPAEPLLQPPGQVSGAASGGGHDDLHAAIKMAKVPGYDEYTNHPIGRAPSGTIHHVVVFKQLLDWAAAGTDKTHSNAAKTKARSIFLITSASDLAH